MPLSDNPSRFWKNLSPRTRLIVGVGAMGYALSGMFLSDLAEKKFGLEPTPEDKRKLEEMIPKIRSVEKGQR